MLTNSRIAHGDQLGAQMTTLANLMYLSEVNDQELVFYNELKNFRRGYQFLDVFNCSGIKLIESRNSLIRALTKRIKRIDSSNWKNSMKMTYFSKFKYYKDRIVYEFIKKSYYNFKQFKDLSGAVHCDKTLLILKDSNNYDVIDGFGTYQDWKSVENRVKAEFSFRQGIVNDGDSIFRRLDLKGLQPVSVHFRLTDYLVLSSLNLKLDYYKKALGYFDDTNCIYLVFSDDIEKVKGLGLFNNRNVIYMDGGNRAAIDMYLMTKCSGGNIIANSTFSFCGGYLNDSSDKKVICPRNFVDENTKENYINGNYYPESWIAI